MSSTTSEAIALERRPPAPADAPALADADGDDSDDAEDDDYDPRHEQSGDRSASESENDAAHDDTEAVLDAEEAHDATNGRKRRKVNGAGDGKVKRRRRKCVGASSIDPGDGEDQSHRVTTRQMRAQMEADPSKASRVFKVEKEATDASKGGKDGEHEDARKKRIDDLWKMMNAPSKSKATPTTTIPTTTTTTTTTTTANTEMQKKPGKTYEFAGETFTIGGESTDSAVRLSATTTKSAKPEDRPVSSAPLIDSVAPPPAQPPRPKSLLMDMAAKYGVTQQVAKLNTLEKSKLDWLKHVEVAGDKEKLKRHNKDGYLERQAFLERSKEKQEEIVKTMKQQSVAASRKT